MRYKILISKDAHNDVDAIVEYIFSELKSPQAASNFLDSVESSYHQLAGNPHIFSLCSDERLERLGYRKVVIKNYLVLYRISETDKTVYIVRVLYGGRNYPALL